MSFGNAYWFDELKGYLEDVYEADYDDKKKVYVDRNTGKVVLTRDQLQKAYDCLMEDDYMWNTISDAMADALRNSGANID